MEYSQQRRLWQEGKHKQEGIHQQTQEQHGYQTRLEEAPERRVDYEEPDAPYGIERRVERLAQRR